MLRVWTISVDRMLVSYRYRWIADSVSTDQFRALSAGHSASDRACTDATFRPELIVTGTYDWIPKKRDVMRFAREYAAEPQRLAVFADALPVQGEQLLAARPIVRDTSGQSIRLGLITDRFTAGHKLKTTEYIAGNCVVLTFAEIEQDFLELPDREFFIRQLKHAREIASHAGQLSSVDPGELLIRFSEFKRRCIERFDWQTTADSLLAALSEGVR